MIPVSPEWLDHKKCLLYLDGNEIYLGQSNHNDKCTCKDIIWPNSFWMDFKTEVDRLHYFGGSPPNEFKGKSLPP